MILGATLFCVVAGITADAQPLRRERHFRVSAGETEHRVEEIFPAVTWATATPDGGRAEEPQTDKVHPLLRAMIERGSNEIVEVIIGFNDGVAISRMPKQLGNEPADSPFNTASRATAQRIITDVTAQRESRNAGRRERLRRDLGVQVIETFWLTGAWYARVPLDNVALLAAEHDVLTIEPTGTGLSPPAYRGRALLNTDWFGQSTNMFYELSEVLVALLDTGVRRTHVMLNNPAVIRHWRDCYNGTSNHCATGSNLNPNDNYGHGTASAGVISGNAALGNNYRGVAGFTIDSYKIYRPGGIADEPATLRAFSAAVAEGAWVIVAEMQWPHAFTGSIAAAAESAFDAGASVVAANGNSNEVTSVASPANAHRVLGIGAVESTTGVTQTYQVSGPTSDLRIKPDVQMPSDPLVTSGHESNTDFMSYDGTSAATAWAGGVSALLHRWYCDSPMSWPCNAPGVNHAAMIQFGTLSHPFQSNRGAGTVRLMGCYGWDQFGSVTVQNEQWADIPVSLNAMTGYAAPADWQVALWWPETPSQTHNRVTLELRNPSNTTVLASSTNSTSVFQRARVGGTLSYGTYYLRIIGAAVIGAQEVFYSSRARQSTGCQ